MLEKTLESPLDCKEIQPVHPKGDQSWIFIGRTDAEAETPILWLPDEKSWVTGKDPDAGKDWRQEEKGTTEDEMVGWHHWLNGHEFEWALVVGDGQGSLSCCSPWGCKELNMTEWLNWAELKVMRRRTGEYGRKTEGFALGWRLRKQRVEDRNDCYDKIVLHRRTNFLVDWFSMSYSLSLKNSFELLCTQSHFKLTLEVLHCKFTWTSFNTNVFHFSPQIHIFSYSSSSLEFQVFCAWTFFSFLILQHVSAKIYSPKVKFSF